MQTSTNPTVVRNFQFPDWKSIFAAAVTEAKIPGTEAGGSQGPDWVMRAPYINLGEVQTALAGLSNRPVNVYLYADVLHIPDNCSFALTGQGLTIVARRIEALSNSAIYLDYTSSPNAVLVCLFETAAGQPQVIGVTKDRTRPQVFVLAPSAGAGVAFTKSGDAMVRTDIDRMPAELFGPGSPLWLCLTANFQIATVLSSSDFATTNGLLAWVKRVAGQAPAGSEGTVYDWQLLFMQASSLLTTLQAMSGEKSFVPGLDRSIYEKLVQSFVAATEAADEQYQRFMDKNEQIEARKEAATLMLKHAADTASYTEHLVQQARTNYLGAENAAFQAKQNLEYQNTMVEVAKIGFEHGLWEWQHDQQIKAAWEILTGIVEFAAAVGLMLVGDEAAAPAAAEAAAQAATKAPKLAEDMKKLSEMIEKLGKVAKAAASIATAAGDAAKIPGTVEALKNVDLSSSKAQSLADITVWKAFSLEAANNLQRPIDLGVPAAGEYKVALQTLALYGEALSLAQQNFAEAAQRYADLVFRQQVDQNQVARLKQYIADLSASELPNDDMMQQMYQRSMDVRRSMYVALLQYTQAYRYWALADSAIHPCILDDVPTLKSDLATLQQEYADALSSFDPPPQVFSGVKLRFDAAGLLGELRENRKVRLLVPIDAPSLIGMNRVRLTTLRVWLEGLSAATAPNAVYLQVVGAGVYRDRLHGQYFDFSTSLLKRVFQYKLEASGKPSIVVDGKVADQQAFAYFEPTPFSEWEINVPSQVGEAGSGVVNQGLDLSAVTAITLELAGSLIGSISTLRVLSEQ